MCAAHGCAGPMQEALRWFFFRHVDPSNGGTAGDALFATLFILNESDVTAFCTYAQWRTPFSCASGRFCSYHGHSKNCSHKPAMALSPRRPSPVQVERDQRIMAVMVECMSVQTAEQFRQLIEGVFQAVLPHELMHAFR
jgi:hypothetical protein